MRSVSIRWPISCFKLHLPGHRQRFPDLLIGFGKNHALGFLGFSRAQSKLLPPQSSGIQRNSVSLGIRMVPVVSYF